MGATLFALLTGETPMDLFVTSPDNDRWDPVEPGLRPLLQQATRHRPEERPASALPHLRQWLT